MSMQNMIILAVLMAGIASLIAGSLMNGKSSFEDGSFIVQIILFVFGGCAVVIALLCKFILSLFS